MMEENSPSIDERQASFVLRQVLDAFSKSKTSMETIHEEMRRLFSATYVMKGGRKSGSNFFFPKAFEHVDRIKATLLGDSPKFKVNLLVNKNPAKPEQDLVAYSRAIELGLQHFWDCYSSSEDLDSIVSAGLSQRIGYAKVGFRQKTMKVSLDEGLEQEEVIAEYPFFESLDPLRVFFDPTIAKWDDLPFVIYAAGKVRKSELMKNKHNINKDKIENMVMSSKTERVDRVRDKFNEQGFLDDADQGEGEEFVDLIEYYGYIKLAEDDSIEDEVLYKVLVAGDSVIVRMEPITFIPIEKFTPFKIPNQIIGHGITSIIEQAQRAYNLMRSMRFDNVGLTINQMFKYKLGSGINVKYLKSRQGGIIPVKDMDDLQPLQIPDVTGNAFNETNSLSTEMQQIAATIDPTQSSSVNSFTNTATGEAIRYNIFQQRVKKIRENLEVFLANLGRKLLLRIAEEQRARPLTVYNKEVEQFYQVVDDVFDNVSDFFSVDIDAGSTVFDSPENQRDEALALTQLGIAMKAQGVGVNLEPIARRVFSTFKGVDVNEVLVPVQEGAESGQGGGQIPQSVVDQVGRVGETIDEQFNKQINDKL